MVLCRDCLADLSPAPPKTISNIGYLQIQKEVEIQPGFKRFMIMPHAQLIILNQDINNFTLIFPAKTSALCCILPKYVNHMALLREGEQKNFLSFRGPIEVETIPFILHKGEELSITKKDNASFYLLVIRKGVQLSLIVPVNTPNTLFSSESKFAKFAKTQNKKGLVYYNKQWIPKEDAAALRNLEQAENLRKTRIWETMKRAADLGVVVLKSGRVLNGRVTGRSQYKMLFLSKKRDYSIGIDDVALITFSEIMARDKLHTAVIHFNKAKKLLRDNRGSAMHHAEVAMKNLKGILKEVKTEYATAQNIIAEVASFIDNINSSLTKAGEVIYHDTIFPVKILDYHTQRGDILLRKKFWLKPEQLCRECNASGKLTCPTCYGKGRLIDDCIACVGGRITCTICEGRGRKKCSYCNGKGYIYVEKKQSTVIASFGSFGGGYGGCGRYYPRYGGGGSVYSSGRFMIFRPRTYYGYPYNRGSYLSIGNEEKAVKQICPKCNGTGTRLCPKTEKCIKCDGVGYFIEICPTCSGNKNISCSKCDGKGFSGEPQKDPVEKEILPGQESKDGSSSFKTPVAIP